MKSSEIQYSAKAFSHIYVEEQAYSYDTTKNILNRFPDSHVITINHYKDVFNRSRQDFLAQKNSQALILAVNNGELIYPGARVCQSFGNEHFYYTSNIMNCVFDCEYCYLQGMYPSGNMVIFVNIEDYFDKVKELLAQHPMYICISYDTDILAVEAITGLTARWIEFTANNPNLTIEIRTKSAYDLKGAGFVQSDRVIYAWTLSPDEITKAYEHHTPSLAGRLNAVNQAISMDCSVRLCFDPMIYIKDYQRIYGNFYKTVFQSIDASKVQDVSLGLFRISADYMKYMRRKRTCAITAYPYTTVNNVCSYEQKKSDEMLNFARLELAKYINPSKIYTD